MFNHAFNDFQNFKHFAIGVNGWQLNPKWDMDLFIILNFNVFLYIKFMSLRKNVVDIFLSKQLNSLACLWYGYILASLATYILDMWHLL